MSDPTDTSSMSAMSNSGSPSDVGNPGDSMYGPISLHIMNQFALQQYPTIALEMLVLMESLRTVPAEFRMYRRAWKRGGLNAAETLFILIKYTLLVGTVLDTLIQVTTIPQTGKQCWILAWFSTVFCFLCSFLVAASLAWRCYVIHGLRRKVGRFLVLLLLPHFAIICWAIRGQYHYDSLQDGFCATSEEQYAHASSRSWMLKSDAWYFLYSMIFDWIVTWASCRRLFQAARGPTGFARIGKILFKNNIHYLAVVSVNNTTMYVLMGTVAPRVPPLILISIVVQAITGLNMIMDEQEAVYTTLASRGAPRKRDSEIPTYPRLRTDSKVPYDSNQAHSARKGISSTTFTGTDRSRSFMASGDRFGSDISTGLVSNEVYVIGGGGGSPETLEFEKCASDAALEPSQPFVSLCQSPTPSSTQAGYGHKKPGSVGGISIRQLRASLASPEGSPLSNLGNVAAAATTTANSATINLPSRPTSCYITRESYTTFEESCGPPELAGPAVGPRPRAHLRQQASLTIQANGAGQISEPCPSFTESIQNSEIVSPAPTFGRYPIGEQLGSTSTLGRSPLVSTDAGMALDRPSHDGSRVSSSSRSVGAVTDAGPDPEDEGPGSYQYGHGNLHHQSNSSRVSLSAVTGNAQQQHHVLAAQRSAPSMLRDDMGHHIITHARSQHLAHRPSLSLDSNFADELNEAPSELPSLINSSNQGLRGLPAHASVSNRSPAPLTTGLNSSSPISSLPSRTATSASIPFVYGGQGQRIYQYGSDIDVEAQRPMTRTMSPHTAGIDEYVDADEDDDTY